MKEGWEYKRFDELMTPAKVERCGGRKDLPVLSITMHGGIVKQKERFNKTIASTDTSNYKVVKDGQLVIAFPIDEGLLYTQDVAKEGIMSPAYNIWDVDYTKIDRKYLVSYFHSRFAFSYYKAKLRGSTQRRRSMDKADLLSMPIPVPSLDVQKHIVSELDLLNRTIEKQKAQLEELDKLAQSIFYDMFGDPITNNLSWDIKFLGDVCSKITDGSHNPPAGIEYSEYLMLSSKNVTNQGFTFYEPRYLTKEQFETENKRTTIQKGDVFLVIVGAGVGKSCVYEANNPITLQRSVAVLKPCYDVLNSNYLNRFLIASHSFICNEAKGAAQKGIYLNQLSKVIIPLPPLSLQQEFAAKVEVIESMKAKVRQSLSEAETLFNSRMDYYFN